MRYALLSSKAPKECIKKLADLGFAPLLLPPFDRLSAPVCTHADMLCFSYDDYIVVHREYYAMAKDIFDIISLECGITLVLADDDIGKEYPHDIAFNAIMLGGKLYSKTGRTSKEITALASSCVNVSQGYAACSTLALSDTYVITADPSLSREYGNNGIEVCLISNGSISLPPYDCGFIGGAAGVYGDTVYFTGNIDTHADADAIKKAISECAMKAVSLSGEPLYDIGGIKFFHKKKQLQ